MERPLSPFMFPTWYRFQLTSVLSILHRLTGIALAVGSILLAWWLVAVAAGGDVFTATHAFITSPIGVLLLFGWSAAFFYHLCSGIRHLAWDAGYGFEIRDAYRTGYAVLTATAPVQVWAEVQDSMQDLPSSTSHSSQSRWTCCEPWRSQDVVGRASLCAIRQILINRRAVLETSDPKAAHQLLLTAPLCVPSSVARGT